MSIGELVPNISVTESSKLDRRSILFLKTFLPDNLVDCRQLEEGGTLPNIDGCLDLLCPDGTAQEKIVVQVKHLTYYEENGDAFYDIPMSIYAYAERHKGELVFFIACDDVSQKFYWRNIDAASIEEFKNKSDHIQTKARYHFQDYEKCSVNNIEATIRLWRKLYKQKMESIKDEKYMVEQFALQQRMCFNSVSSELHGIKDSHIERHQVDDIMQWIREDNVENKICLLAGDAGVGKSAVLKDLISKFSANGVKYLGIKADYIDDNGNPVTLEKIRNTLAYYSTGADKVTLIVDQIDALSQSLTNDRTHLNMMMTVLSSLEDWPNVRAVVSCRKYDLEYDSVLCRLKDKSTVIEIGELTEDEVTMALNNLEKELANRVERLTAKLLRNVQMLDSFSLLYSRNKSRTNFNSRIELYDALWDTIICNPSCRFDVEMLEHLMYKIAETIRIAGTLNPQFAPLSRQKRAYEYLASNGLIRRESGAVSFFHQSFYEYTLARSYSEKNCLFAIDIKKEIQGLEVRSTVKAVLDFKRGHDITKFFEEARSILIDPDIRLHLKLLTLSVLAFVDEPSRGEKRLIIEICKTDERLLCHFLRGVSYSNWFSAIRKMLTGIMSELRKDDTLFFPIILCLSRYAFDNPDKVYGLIDEIKDQDSRLSAAAYLMHAHNDYDNPRVLKAYAETKTQNTFGAVDLVQDAIKSNKWFALNEAEKLILDYLISESSSNKYDIDTLCSELCKDYPTDMLGLLHRCICEIVRRTAVDWHNGYTIATVFNGVITKGYAIKLLKMYEKLLRHYASEKAIARPFVEELLLLNNETTLSMAFVAMAEAPKIYDDLIRPLLTYNRKIEEYLCGKIDFSFLKMLRAWYYTLDENTAEWYQRFLLSYKSELDFKYDVERKRSLFLCPHLWWNKWSLICNTLPDDALIPDMKKCSQELMRRFGRKYLVKRRDNSISVSVGCGGVVGDDIYGRWPISNWLSSFLKLDEHKLREGRNPISLHIHSDAFKKCVASNTGRFYKFVLDISSRDDILDIYKIAGLEGLLVGGANQYSLWDLAAKYINEDFARNDSYSFSRIAEYYIQEENVYIDMIFVLCEKLVISLFSDSSETYLNGKENMDLSGKATDLLNKAINSYQGRAAKLLVHMCKIPSRRPMVYGFFTDNATLMHECVKTIPIHYLNVEDYFDVELYFPMMRSILSGMGTEALYIQASTIQWCFYYRNDVVSSYIDHIELDISSHELLVQIYFYGMIGTNESEECEKRLERILALNNEKVVAKAVEVAMKSYDSEYRELGIKFLERYISDKREKVVKAYCRYCNCLPVEAFNWYCRISEAWIDKKYRDIYNQLKYVKKCISTYPIQCYRFISSQKYFDIEDARLVNDEVVKILLEIYRKLSLDEDTDAMNEVLDLFDEYIYRDNRVMNEAVQLL